MKKIITLIVISTLMIAGCSSGKYADKIDKAVINNNIIRKNLQNNTKVILNANLTKKMPIYMYMKKANL